MNITAVIPAYNAESTLLRAISSVLAQSYQDFELIIVDDGSSDGTLELANTVQDQRVKTISQINMGPGAARNAGLRVAQGRWIAFLDADDTWESDFFSDALAVLLENPGILFYFGGSQTTTATVRRKLLPGKRIPYVFQVNKKATSKRLKRQVEGSLCVMLADKSTISSLGGYYDKNKCTYGEDSVLCFLIFWLYPVVKSGKIVHTYNQSGTGLSISRHTNVQAKAMVADPDYLYARLPNGPERAVHTYIAYLASIDAYRFAKVGNSAKGYKLIIENGVLRYAYLPSVLVSIVRFAGYTLTNHLKR